MVVAISVFGLLHLSPGDPAAIIAGDTASPADIVRIRAALGLDQPLYIQFGDWAWRLLHGDLGISIFTNLPVSTMIAQRIEPTISLSISTLLISVMVAIPIGVLAAWKAGAWIDRLVMAFAVLGFSVPVFVVAYLLIYGFAIGIELFPGPGLCQHPRRHWAVPVAYRIADHRARRVYIALIARITRATMLDVLAQDYIRTARPRASASEQVLFVHALKNAAVPIVTVIGIGVALLIGGVVVTESVFAIPGIGRLTVDAILRRDYPVIQGVILICSAGLCAGQPARRSQLYAARSEDPLLRPR